MNQFVVIDFETANPSRVSACALGYTIVEDNVILESNGFLMKPVGGHAPFQTRIHGIGERDTANKSDFGSAYPSVAHLFDLPIVGHSMFDKQVLKALSDHFGLRMRVEYTDSVALARQRLPDLKNHKLKTLAKHFGLPRFEHHDASEDARACAEIYLRLQDTHMSPPSDPSQEFESLASAILDDDQVDYKEAYQLMYWLEDNRDESAEMESLLSLIRETLADAFLQEIEGEQIQERLKLVLRDRSR